MKATYGEITKRVKARTPVADWHTVDVVEAREIWKDPITDDGTKKSKKGLLCVYESLDNGKQNFQVLDQCTWEQENSSQNSLTTIFKDSKLVKTTTLDEIRAKLTV